MLTKCNVDTFVPELLPQSFSAFEHEILVECGSNIDSSGKDGVEVG
jgi:hypothetical protein